MPLLEEGEQLVIFIHRWFPMSLTRFLGTEPGFQTLAQPLESPVVLRLFLLDLVDDVTNSMNPLLQLLLLISPGLFSAAQGCVLPLLHCLQLLLARLIGHKLQKVLSKAVTEITLIADCTQKRTK